MIGSFRLLRLGRVRALVALCGLCGACASGGCILSAPSLDEFLLATQISTPMLPTDLGLAFSAFEVSTSGGQTIRGWWVPTEDAVGTVLHTNGQGSTMSAELAVSTATIALMHNLRFNLVFWDYPGAGMSDGPTELSAVKPALRAVIDATVARGDPGTDRIVLSGLSFGAGVAVSVTAERPTTVVGLLLIAPFETDAALQLPIVGLASVFLNVDAFGALFDPVAQIREIDVPLLILSSVHDQNTPFAGAQALFNAAPEPKTLIRLEGRAVSGALGAPAHLFYEEDNGPAYSDPIRGFLDALIESPSP